MSERELLDWYRFEATTAPLPDKLIDLHFAALSSLAVNLMRSSTTAPVSFAEFLIIREPRPAPPSSLTESERLRAQWEAGG